MKYPYYFILFPTDVPVFFSAGRALCIDPVFKDLMLDIISHIAQIWMDFMYATFYPAAGVILA
jgi:hypothetical protein